MELKAVCDYEKPEYLTEEENKNKWLMLMLRTGKISLGVAVMFLLVNCSFANQFSNYEGFQGGIAYELEASSDYNLIEYWIILVSIISLVVTVVLGIVIYKKYKKCEDLEEKEGFKKLKNKIFIIGSIICLLFVILCIII